MRRKLKYLEQQGLIRRGDQRMVAHFDPYHRPVVWDLCLDRKREIDFTFGDDIEESRGGRPRGATTLESQQPIPMQGQGKADVAEKPTSATGGGLPSTRPSETPSRSGTGFHSRDTSPLPPLTHSTSLVRDVPPPPSGESPHGFDDPRAQSAPAGRRALELCRLMADCRRRPPALPIDDLEHPGDRMIEAASRLIDDHGFESVCRVARWATLPPDMATPTTPVCSDGFWRSSISDPARLARKYDKLVAQMLRPSPASTHGPTAPPAPSYGMQTQLDRRVDRLLEPFGESDGNDGLVARRTLVEQLRAGVEERTAVSRALAAGRDALDGLRRQREADQARERERRSRPVRHMFAGHIPQSDGI